MDVYGLKKYIIDEPDYIELILENTGFHNVFDRGDEVRCAREMGSNPTAVRVNKSTLASQCFSSNVKGDLITLIQNKTGFTFNKTLKYISHLIDYEPQEDSTTIIPFGGYYKKIAKLKSNEIIDLETYSDEVLYQFESMPSLLFYEDGILPHVQMKFKIGYDAVTSRITVPWYSFDGKLIGIMGRLNKREVAEGITKWIPLYEFPKSKVLYGYVQNYKSIVEKKIVMLGESEKFTMQLNSKGIDVGLSLGGCFLSDIQANHIKSMFPETILVMLDEGISQEHSYDLTKQLKSDKYYKNKVGYIYDKNNDYLPKGSKLAPSDLDRNTLNNLIKNCVIWM